MGFLLPPVMYPLSKAPIVFARLFLIALTLAMFPAATTEAVEPANSLEIDRFEYLDTTSVQAAWKLAEAGSPEPDVVLFEEKPTVTLATPFASQAEKVRFSIDRKVDLDLSRATSLSLEVNMGLNSDAQVSIYLRSGNGWYSGAAYVTKPGWRKIDISRERYSSEGTPSGWDKIDGVRIAVWPYHQARLDTSIRLRSLQASWNNLAIILPNEESGEESKDTKGIGDRMVSMLQEIGVGVDLISEDSLPSGILGDRPLTILPYNPKLSQEAVAALETYVTSGGKLFLSYSLPTKLANVLGFEKGTYVGETKPGDFATIHFDNQSIPGMPTKVEQASWNVIPATPVAYNARVIGTWLDRDGKSTGYPALLVSDRGAFLSHILLPDDPKNKTAMLAALLGELNPGFWVEAAQNAQQEVRRVGHCQTEEELEKFIGNGPGAGKLAESKQTMTKSAELLESGNAFESHKVALDARQQRVDAYLVSHPSPTVEARAFWNHTGTGAYPGDWERTTREMAAAGMNMVMPNMLWGAQAHYPSDILPRSKTFDEFGDQLEQCVAAGKKNGIEVHVWKVNFNIGYGVPQEYIDQLRKEDRLQVSVDGEDGNWLNPAHPKNFQMELDSILEVVRKYDIDGFHFDYIRYPDSRHDFSEYSRKKFEADTGHAVKNWPADCYDGPLLEAYTDWRCGNITHLVKAVSEQARMIRPGIKISAAVFRDYPNCRKWVAQDWPLWAKEGYVDFLCPMDYTDDDEQYIDWITSQKSLLPEGFPLYPGIGISLRNKTQSIDRVVGQIFLNRKVGTGGFTIFDMNKTTLQSVANGLSKSSGKSKSIPPHHKRD